MAAADADSNEPKRVNIGQEDSSSRPSDEPTMPAGPRQKNPRDEYIAALNQWLWQCYHWQCFAVAFPYLTLQAASQNRTTYETVDINRNLSRSFVPNQNLVVGQRPQQRQNAPPRPGREFKLPSLWKRFAAELLDSFILLFVKLLVTYIAIDYFDIIDLDKYDLDTLREEALNYRVALEVTTEVMFLELIHRVLVCLYETICLHQGTDMPGGRTPGKSIFGLRVVSCVGVEEIGDNRVRVYPAGDIGIGRALLRSFVKNFTLALLFPACLTIFCFKHGRAAYDILCHCVVVEDIPRPNRN
ncbi:protein FAM8A1-like [Ornithodoros turicata]|uniref:protein FAM8A1-like n=1 Tax=Ornithodoros turicata TaxID=34597 RepID=UPI003138B28B